MDLVNILRQFLCTLWAVWPLLSVLANPSPQGILRQKPPFRVTDWVKKSAIFENPSQSLRQGGGAVGLSLRNHMTQRTQKMQLPHKNKRSHFKSNLEGLGDYAPAPPSQHNCQGVGGHHGAREGAVHGALCAVAKRQASPDPTSARQ